MTFDEICIYLFKNLLASFLETKTTIFGNSSGQIFYKFIFLDDCSQFFPSTVVGSQLRVLTYCIVKCNSATLNVF